MSTEDVPDTDQTPPVTDASGMTLTRIGRRRPRMSEQQTRSLMLTTAIAAVRQTGLTVSLEHISMEDVIRESGVSRTAAYRCWPQKEQFIGDLVLELARAAIPATNVRGAEATQLIAERILPRLEELGPAEVRWRFATDLVGAASVEDFRETASLTESWRTYFSLIATVMNLPEGDLRDQVQQAIAESERLYGDRLVANYRIIAELLGFRLADPENVPMHTVADLLIALMRGLILQHLALATPDRPGEPPEDPVLSPAALGFTAILARCFETDPEVVWDTARITTVRNRLTSTSNLFDDAHDGG